MTSSWPAVVSFPDHVFAGGRAGRRRRPRPFILGHRKGWGTLCCCDALGSTHGRHRSDHTLKFSVTAGDIVVVVKSVTRYASQCTLYVCIALEVGLLVVLKREGVSGFGFVRRPHGETVLFNTATTCLFIIQLLENSPIHPVRNSRNHVLKHNTYYYMLMGILLAL